MNIIREWIITITSVIIFVTFVEILVPNSNNKRYINVVVGILIMLVILNPLFHYLQGDISLESGILKASNEIEYKTMVNRMDQNIDQAQNEAIIELYKSKLANQMQYRLKNMQGYSVEDIKLEVEDKNVEEFGTIKQLDIVLRSLEEKEEVEHGDIEAVNIQVVINKNNNTQETESIMLSNEGKAIRSDFSSYYDIPEENINIYILEDK